MNYYKKQEDKMETKYLVIMEVSQKQAFIFSSNELKDNVTNSAIIAWVTNPKFFEEQISDRSIYSTEKNIVYSGGGHTVLVFDKEENAEKFVQTITLRVMEKYEGLELFAKRLKCKGDITGEELKQLSQDLEVKKSKRKSAFHQGSFGIESKNERKKYKMPEEEEKIDKELMAKNFNRVWKFEDLGGTEHESNFIAVVHIDGNAMGKRVEEFRESIKEKPWEEYRKAQKEFSDNIDKAFKNAYKEMVEEVANRINEGKLQELDLKHSNFPVRRIITAGDDICFVSEGRIGIECAAVFLKKLKKQNYSACAGVAIVHQKYPFYRAYELAESLCSNAKKFVANIDPDDENISRHVSAIDWHIEYGEMKESLEEIREMYKIEDPTDPSHLELRPYIVDMVEAPESIKENIKKKEDLRWYENFKKLMKKFSNEEISYARGKIKELRSYLKQGENAAKYYMKCNLIDELSLIGYQGIFREVDPEKAFTGTPLERNIFEQTHDEKKRCLLFDAIEILDTFIALDKEEGGNERED